MTDRIGVDMPERTCSIEGCEKRFHCRGWCGVHYIKSDRYADLSSRSGGKGE